MAKDKEDPEYDIENPKPDEKEQDSNAPDKGLLSKTLSIINRPLKFFTNRNQGNASESEKDDSQLKSEKEENDQPQSLESQEIARHAKEEIQSSDEVPNPSKRHEPNQFESTYKPGGIHIIESDGSTVYSILKDCWENITSRDLPENKSEYKSIFSSLTNDEQISTSKIINEKIEEKIKSNTLKNIEPEYSDTEKEASYQDGEGGTLKQLQREDGRFDFEPKKFTGILRVERQDKDGNLIPNSVDIIEYKYNKKTEKVEMSSVISGKIGTSRIANFTQKLEQFQGISVSTTTEKTRPAGITVTTPSPTTSHKPRSGPYLG